jgi:hypothetical protein
MNEPVGSIAIPGLRWCVGLIVLWPSGRLAFGESAKRGLAQPGLPRWIRPGLGGTEVFAAASYLLPITTVVGGDALLGIFFPAAVLHGWYDVSALVVSFLAVLVSLAHRSGRIRGGREGHPA